MRQHLLAAILALCCCRNFAIGAEGTDAAQLAQAVIQSITEDQKVQALVPVARAMRVGVYRASSGEAVVRGAERASADFYLYDFELGIIARSLLRGDTW